MGGAEGFHDIRIELGSRAAADFFEGRLGTQALTVRPLRRHGIVGVADGDDPRPEGNVLSRELIRIPTAVVALVARTDQAGDVCQGGCSRNDPLPDQSVLADELPLVGRGGLAC